MLPPTPPHPLQSRRPGRLVVRALRPSAPAQRTALLLVAGLVGACGDGPEDGPPAFQDPFCQATQARVSSFLDSAAAAAPASDDGRYGGTVVVAGARDLTGGINAFTTSDYGAAQHQQFVNLMTLVQLDEALEPVPYLATDWSFDARAGELTFRLRDDVYWHDGERTDAYDVAFTYRRATDPATAYPNAAFWSSYVPGEAGVQVVDSFTLVVRLEPHAEILDPWRFLAIMPEHLLGDVPPEELARHPFGERCPVGNGPFAFVSRVEGDAWTFRANPAFPADLGGRPFLDRLVYRVVPDQNTLLAELLTGGVDVYVGVRSDQAGEVVRSDAAELRVFAPREFNFVAWNTRRPELADPRVRRALTMAVDRAALVEALFGGYGRVAHSGVPPFHWAYRSEAGPLAFDPPAAERLLDEAGWRDRDGDGLRESPQGRPLSLDVIFNGADRDRSRVGEVLQAQLAAVGVDVDLVPLEGGAVAARATAADRDFHGLILGWTHEFKVDERDLFHSEARDRPFGFAGLDDPEVDLLLDTLQRVVDRTDARPLWVRYQERIGELQPFTYLYFAQKLTGVSAELAGAEMDFRGEWIHVGRWRVEAGSRP